MAITAAVVNELRQATGCGLMDCKKALIECEGDMEKAVMYLREKGLASQAKKASRVAAEGMAYATVIDGVGVVVEVNAETDFVGKNEKFQNFVKGVAAVVAKEDPKDLEALMAAPYGNGRTVEQERQEMVLVIGENIQVRRFARFVPEHGMVDTYNHMGGRIGVMVELSCPEVTDEIKALSHDLVMHIAAANPQFVRRDEVPTDNLEKEREVLTQQALNEGKPAKIVERMVEGRIEKYYKEVCLLEQPFVKDPDINVTKMLGGKADVVRFVRFERGEGLEKRQDNLAADIAAEQAKMKK